MVGLLDFASRKPRFGTSPISILIVLLSFSFSVAFFAPSVRRDLPVLHVRGISCVVAMSTVAAVRWRGARCDQEWGPSIRDGSLVYWCPRLLA
jgi:hypothetical protein